MQLFNGWLRLINKEQSNTLMNTTFKNLAYTALAVTLLMPTITACAQKGIKASKNYITKDVKVSEFNAIELLGSPDIVYTQNNDGKTSVEIYGSDNLVDLLEVSVQKNTLVVKFKPNSSYYGESRLEVRATSPSLNRATLKGSGDVKLNSDITSDNLEINLQGSGDIKSNGNIFCKRTLKTMLQGSGDIDLYKNVQCSVATVTLQGSGDIKIQNMTASSGSIKLQGSGDIDVKEYCKSGELTVGLQGSGDVKIKNIESTSTNAELSGSGDMELSGDTQTAVLTLNNSGNIRADKMKAQTVKATVKGSGDITCYATEELVGNVLGSGSIRYKGEPKVQSTSKIKPL